MFTFIAFFTLLAQCSLASVHQDEGYDISALYSRAQGRKLTGNSCEYIYLCHIIDNSGCEDGSKFVIKQANNTHKKFLLLDGEAVLAFVTNGEKFKDCPSYTNVTGNVTCKVVDGGADIDLPRSAIEGPGIALSRENYLEIPLVNTGNKKVNKRKGGNKQRLVTGAGCEFIYLCNITENLGCEDGSRLKIKPENGTRKQLLLLNSEPVLAFVTDGTKFANCSSYTEITTAVDCKVSGALAELDLGDGHDHVRILEEKEEGKILVVDMEDGTKQLLDSEDVHF